MCLCGATKMGASDFCLSENPYAPEFFCNGLGRVQIVDGTATFNLFRARPTIAGAESDREINVSIVMPCEAVGPAIELTLVTFGPRLILPGVILAARRWMI